MYKTMDYALEETHLQETARNNEEELRRLQQTMLQQQEMARQSELLHQEVIRNTNMFAHNPFLGM